MTGAAAGGAEGGASAGATAATNTGPAASVRSNAPSSATESVQGASQNRVSEAPGGDEVSLLDAAALEAAAPPRYGKFGNDAEAVYKAWENADKALNGKADKLLDLMDRNDLREKMIARGVIEAVPETYENLRESFEAAGLEAFEDDHPSWAEFTQECREQGLTQKQVEWAIRKYGQMETANFAQWGTLPNLEQENQSLEKVWGPQTKEIKSSLRRWLMNGVTNGEIDQALFDKPLKRTAFGLQVLKGFMDSRREPRPMTDTNRPNRTAFRIETIGAKISELMRNPAYRNSFAPNHAQVHAEVDRLFRQKAKLEQE